MRNWKKVAISIAVAGMIAGCGGVDKQKLADLTAGKSFKQIEEAYSLSVLNSSPNSKIYAYWLKQNGKKADPTFQFDLIQMKVAKSKKELEKKIDDQIKQLPTMSYNSLKMLQTQASFMSLNLNIFHKLLDEIQIEIDKRLKK